MKMIIKLLMLLLAMLAIEGSADDVDVVMSFAKMDERPVSVLIPHICWDNYKLISLVKDLCNAGITVAYSFQQDRTEAYLQHVIVLADLSCAGTGRFLEDASDRELFKSPYRWLLLSRDADLSILDNLSVLIDSDVVVAQMGQEKVMFTEAYKITQKTEVIFTTRASWQSVNSLQNSTDNTTYILYMSERTVHGAVEDYRESKVLSTRRRDLRRNILIAGNVITDTNDTKNHLDDRLFLHQDSISKMSYIMISICFDMLNATVNSLFMSSWGYKGKDGNWTGLVNHLIHKEADLGTMTTFTLGRTGVIDYIAMVGYTAIRFVFRKPPLPYTSNIFTLPFTSGLWMACLVCVLGCALFMLITSKWEASRSVQPREAVQLDGSWADVLILIIAAVLQQGCTQEPRNAAGRMVMLILFIAMTTLYAAYSANIIVLLQAPSDSVRSLRDLYDSPLKLGASDFEYNRYFVQHLTEPLRKTIYEERIAPKGKKPNFISMEEGVEKIRQGLFAFNVEVNPAYRLIQETFHEIEKCDLVEIDYINEICPWVPGQRRAAHKDLFKINFIKIRETGIQSCMQHRLYVPKPKCSGSVATFSSVGIIDMYPAIIGTLYMVLMAPAVLLLEIAHHKLMKVREKAKLMRRDQEALQQEIFY